MGVKYVHTNLVARDWRRLARFYEEVLSCVPVPPARDYGGRNLEAATGLPGARLEGLHLRLPGHGEDGPTLEIFAYEDQVAAGRPAINRPGFAHIAFAVEDVAAAREAFLAAGGSDYGAVTRFETSAGQQVEMVYLRDPEGNIVELQHWLS